jgi:TRAP-type mannitol/chloroaromatic compound transport system substrate-binding protein
MKNLKIIKSSIKNFIAFAGILAVSLILVIPVQAKTLTVISGFPQTHLYTTGCLGIFQENLKLVSGGNLSLNISGPDVVPTNEQFQPLQAGVFDLLFTHAAYHLGETAVGASIEAIDPDPVKRRENGIIDYVDNQYNKIGVKLVASLPITQYNIVLKDPINDRNPSLKGLKIRTASLGAPAVEALGGAPVNLPPGDIYTSLQKGVIDGFTLVAVGLKDFKIHEVAGYLVRPQFAFISASLFMNLNKFSELTDQEKEWINSAAIKSEKDSFAYFKTKHDEEVTELKALGMKETQLQPADAQKIEQVFSATIWAVAEKKSGESVKNLHQLALDKGMTK